MRCLTLKSRPRQVPPLLYGSPDFKPATAFDGLVVSYPKGKNVIFEPIIKQLSKSPF